jgi:hypothetical protein
MDLIPKALLGTELGGLVLALEFNRVQMQVEKNSDGA